MISSRWPRPSANRRIDDQHAGLHRLADQIAIDDRGGGTLDRLVAFGIDRSATVERAAQRIDDATEQGPPDRHAHHLAGAADAVAASIPSASSSRTHPSRVAVQGQGEADLTVVEAHAAR